MGLITLIGMGGIGALIIQFFHDKDWRSVFDHGEIWYIQISVGITYGSIAAYLALLLLKQKFMADIKGFYADLFSEMDLSLGAILFISYCAGFGEELLFRGAIQYYLGIFITSIIFVAIHGYLNPKDLKLSIYGVYMTIIIIGIGFMYEKLGMISAMSAHFIIDVILLYSMKQEKEKKNINSSI